MAGVEDNLEKFLNADRIIIVTCGNEKRTKTPTTFLSR
jgi:hypothetical protein